MLRLIRHGTRAHPGPLRASLISVSCLFRCLPLFVASSPRTPLRVLCIVALDTIHSVRFVQPLRRQMRKDLAALLDFQACANAVWDHKDLCPAEYEALGQRLEAAGWGEWTTEYLRRLHDLETQRPSVGGDRRQFEEVRAYRESVVRLSLAMNVALALNASCLDEAITATYRDRDVAALFRLAMQCQVIDDVLDYEQDLAAGRPSFLTAASSLPQAMAWTAEAARSYGATREQSAPGGVWLPLQTALAVITAVTTGVLRVARCIRFSPTSHATPTERSRLGRGQR